MAENDWIVAGINNPEFTVADFANFADLTTDNTQLLGVDDYINSDFIQNSPYFKDQAGNFDEDRFRNYYAARAQEFDQFAQDEFYRGPALDMFDLDRTPDTPVIDIQFNITRGYNPDRQKIGIEGVNIWSDPEFSQRELAKQNLVFNTEKGEFEDFTVNDHVLVSNPVEWLKSLWKDPLVLATWDEDGVHVDPMTGLPQEHMKGQPKLNEKGTYYYETLGNRSVLGKDVLSMFDTFTVDGQGLNKYDFFDSNDLKKSVGGTVMKNAVMLLPMFIPSIAGIYSGVLMGRELAKTLPVLTGMITAVTGGETPLWAEKASAWAQRATPSMDDWSMQHPFAAGHFIGLVTDLALLTGQQRFIADSLGTLRGTQRIMEEAEANAKALFATKANRYKPSQLEDVWQACKRRFMPEAEKRALKAGQLGRDLGLAYIALTFQSGTYNEMLLHGASKQAASAVALGSMLGMFSVDKWLHLGEIFYDDATGNATKIARQIAKEQADAILGKKGAFVENNVFKIDVDTQGGLFKAIRKAHDKAAELFGNYSSALKYHTLTVTGKMLGSGIERISETLCSDISKGLYELAGKMGMDTSAKDVGAFENMGERYGMAFLAGVIGSGVFYGKELMQRGSIAVPKLTESMMTLIRNGHADEMREEVDRLQKKGLLGSNKLSLREIRNSDGKITGYETAKNGEMTQSDIVAMTIKQNIDGMEELINNNQLGLSDDALFDNIVLGEERMRRFNNYFNVTDYYSKIGELMANFYKTEKEWESAMASPDGDAYTTDSDGKTVLSENSKEANSDVKRDAKKSEAQAAVVSSKREAARKRMEEAKKAVEDFLGGDNSLEYFRKLAFAMDPSISDRYFKDKDSPLDINSYCESKFNGKKVSELDPEDLVELYKGWNEYRKMIIGDQLDSAWSQFKALENAAAPILEEIEKTADKYVDDSSSLLDTLFVLTDGGKKPINSLLYTFDSVLPGEQPKQYEARNKRYVGEHGYEESEEEFAARKVERLIRINSLNNELMKTIADRVKKSLDVMEWKVDPMTKRLLRTAYLNLGRPKDIMNMIIDEADCSDVVKTAVRGVDITVKDTGPVLDEIERAVRSSYNKYTNESFKIWYNTIQQSEYKTKDGNTVDFYEVVNRFEDADKKGVTVATVFNRIAEDNLTGKSREALDALEESSLNDLRNLVRNAVGDTTVADKTMDLDFHSLFIEPRQTIEFSYGGKDYEETVNRAQRTVYKPNADRYVNDIVDIEKNNASTLLDRIKNNPIIDLYNRIDTDTVNPVEEMVDALAKKTGRALSDKMKTLLGTIWDKYDNIDNLSKFVIDSDLENDVEVLKGLLDDLNVYITAASTIPNIQNPVGHNVTINEFVEKNKSRLVKPWRRLPEVRNDLANMYSMMIMIARNEIDRFMDISTKNRMDRESKILDTDIMIAKMDFNTINRISDSFTFNGETVTGLRKGFDAIDSSGLQTKDAMVTAYNIAQKLYDNVTAIAKEKGLDSAADLFVQSDLALAFEPDITKGSTDNPGVNEVIMQETVKIDENLDINSTPYSRIMYLITILSKNPAAYYSDLSKRINTNGIVPISSQDIGTRMMDAAVTGDFIRMCDKIYSLIPDAAKDGVPNLTNFVGITGGPGVGKTYSVIGSLKPQFKDKKLFVVGPSRSVGDALSKKVGYTKSENANFDSDNVMDIYSLMTKILGKERYKNLWKEVEEFAISDVNIKSLSDNRVFKSKSFTIYINSRGKVLFNLNGENGPDALFDSTRWAYKGDMPEVIVIDEVQKISALDAQVIAKFARDNGIPVLNAGDMKQDRFALDCGMGSIDGDHVFMARSPELTLSLRSGNIQNFDNLNAFNSRIEEIQHDITVEPNESFNRLQEYKAKAKAIHPEYYADANDINGTMIVKSLDDSVISTLKNIVASGHNIDFIGDQSSPVLAKLRSEGIDIRVYKGEADRSESRKYGLVWDFDQNNVRQSDTPDKLAVNGAEFDYAVVDYHIPEDYLKGESSIDNYPIKLADLLTKINTWTSRARIGTVMIDNGISDIVGKSRATNRKAKAPDNSTLIQSVGEEKLRLVKMINDLAAASGMDTGEEAGETPEETVVEKEETVSSGEESTGGEGTGGEDTGGKKGKNKKSGASAAAEFDLKTALSTNPEMRVIGEDGDDTVKDNEKAINEALNNIADNGEGEKSQYGEAIAGDRTEEEDIDPTAGSDYVNPDLDSVEVYDYEAYPLTVLDVIKGDAVEIKNYNDDGTHKVIPWRITVPESGDIRNLQCFLDKSTEVKTYDNKLDLQKKLDYVRGLAMGSDPQYGKLPAELKKRITKESWDNRKIVLEIRRAYQDTQVPLFSPFEKQGIDFGTKRGRVYVNYVLVLEGDGGRTYKIDLCGLNDPETFAAHQDYLVQKNMKAAELFESKGDTQSAARRRAVAAVLPKAVEPYRVKFNRLVDKFFSEGNKGNDGLPKSVMYDVTDKVTKTLRDWFSKRKGQPMRLSGRVDVTTVDTTGGTKKGMNNFTDVHSEFIVSPVYVVRLPKDGEKGIEPGITRRAVVAVTSFTDEFNPSDLMQAYIEQNNKYNAAIMNGRMPDPPKIRLYVLGNQGLSIRQIMDTDFNKKVTGSTNGITPIEQNYTGAAMLVSLWNARAAVKKFKARVDTWMEENHITDQEQLMALARVHDMLYYGSKAGYSMENAISDLGNAGLSTEMENGQPAILEKFDALNNTVLADVPFFRLGSYLNREAHPERENLGLHIQRYNVNNRMFYGKKKQANMIAVTYECAEGFEKMLDDFLNPIVSKKNAPYAIYDTAKEILLDPETFLNPKVNQGNTLKSLQSVLSNIDKGDVDGINYTNKTYLSLFSRIVTWVAMRSLKGTATRTGKVVYDFSKVKTKKAKPFGKDTVEIDISEWVKNKRAGMAGYDFNQMLAALFHGTTDDPLRKYGVDNKLTRADGVMFRYGFLIRPGANTTKTLEMNVLNKDGKSFTKLILCESDTSGEYFTIDIEPHAHGLNMRYGNFMSIDVDKPVTAKELFAQKNAVETASATSGTVSSRKKTNLKTAFDSYKKTLDKVKDEYRNDRSVSEDTRRMIDESGKNGVFRNNGVRFVSPEPGSAITDNMEVVGSVEDASLDPGVHVVDRVLAPGLIQKGAQLRDYRPVVTERYGPERQEAAPEAGRTGTPDRGVPPVETETYTGAVTYRNPLDQFTINVNGTETNVGEFTRDAVKAGSTLMGMLEESFNNMKYNTESERAEQKKKYDEFIGALSITGNEMSIDDFIANREILNDDSIVKMKLMSVVKRYNKDLFDYLTIRNVC